MATPLYCRQGQSYSKAWGPWPPKILKNYFISCISIKKFKYLVIKIEVAPQCELVHDALKNQ